MRKLMLAVLLFSSTAYAQQTFTLEQAQTYALENNPSVRIAQLDISQANMKVKEFRGLGLPQVNASGSFQHFLSLPTNLIPAQFFNPAAGPDDFIGVRFGTDFNVTGDLNVSQLVFDGSYLTGLKASKMYPVVSQKTLEKVNRDIKMQVEQAYYLAATAAANVSVLMQSNEKNIELLNRTKQVMEEGMTDSTVYDQLLLSVVRLDAQIKRAERSLALALNSLKLSMGMDLAEDITVADDIYAVIETIGIDVLAQDYDPKTDIEYQILETQNELLGLNLQVKKSAYLPSLGAFFNQQYQAQRNEFNIFANEPWYPTTVWGLKLTVPIFSGGTKKYQVSQAAVDLEKMKFTMEQVEQSLQMQYQSAVTEFRSNYEIHLAEKEAFELAQRLQQRTREKYNLSVVSAIEMSQADLQVFQALSSHIQAMYALLEAKVKLDKITNNDQ